MAFIEILILAISLGLDAFSVAVGVGLIWYGPRQIFRLSWHFGFFQAIMPLLGWQLGNILSNFVKNLSAFIACGILVGIGLHMILNAFKIQRETGRSIARDRTRGWSLVLLSIATSLDAFGVGISLGLLVSGIFKICFVIGMTAAVMTIIGMWLGNRMSRAVDLKLEAIAGIVLIILGVKAALN